MGSPALLLIAISILAYALLSGRLQAGFLTPPMAFAGLGLLLHLLGLLDLVEGSSGVHLIAEVTLTMVLFADAARIDLRGLRHDHNLPVRLLVIGLPLGILIGAAAASLLFPGWGWFDAALLAAILVPTDAALGQAVVSLPQVPVRLRQCLNVESGLNDGLALPFVLLFASMVSGMTTGTPQWLGSAMQNLVIGAVAGSLIGLVGAWAMERAWHAGLVTEEYRGIAVVALAALCYLAAEMAGGNGFVSAFTGGMVFGNASRKHCTALVQFIDKEGQVLIIATFLLFGAVMAPELADASLPVWLAALASLLLVRPLASLLALSGSGLRTSSKLFLGWFGPRGLASVLYLLIVVEVEGIPVPAELPLVVIATVALSVVLHGLTAAPAARSIGRRAGQWRAEDPERGELESVREMPLRGGAGRGSDGR